MLVTLLYWWLFDVNWFEMLVSESLCWRLFSLCWWFSQCIKSVTNILNRSPISQTCHQHLVSNIRHQHRCKHSSLIKFVKSHRKFHLPRNRFEISPEYFKVPIKVRLSSIVSVSSTASVVESTPIILGYLHVNFMPGSKSSCNVISSTSRRRRFPPLLPVIIW